MSESRYRIPQGLRYEEIKFVKEGRVYLFTTQGRLEKRVFQSLHSDSSSLNFWQTDANEMPSRFLTITHTSPVNIFCRVRHSSIDQSLSETPRPFTAYPLVMEINIEDYRDGVTANEEGGVAITVPVSIGDITVIRSMYVNKEVDGLPDDERERLDYARMIAAGNVGLSKLGKRDLYDLLDQLRGRTREQTILSLSKYSGEIKTDEYQSVLETKLR